MVFLYLARHCVSIKPSIHRHEGHSKNLRQVLLRYSSLQTVLVELFDEVPVFHTTYYKVAAWADDQHKIIKPNYMGIETNNNGKNVLHLFREKFHMDYLQGVTTSAGLTEKTRDMGFAMDKPFMVHWFKDAMDKKMLKFPKDPSKDMQALIDQIPKITAQTTPGGQTTYKAYRGQHDDLFMAALLCCNFIRLFIKQQEELK